MEPIKIEIYPVAWAFEARISGGPERPMSTLRGKDVGATVIAAAEFVMRQVEQDVRVSA